MMITNILNVVNSISIINENIGLYPRFDPKNYKFIRNNNRKDWETPYGPKTHKKNKRK